MAGNSAVNTWKVSILAGGIYMKDERNKSASSGSLKISQDVIASIAEYTIKETEGVAGLAPISPSFTSWLLEQQTVKPVSITVDDGVCVIDMRICLESGTNIPEVSKKLQSSVKEAVQNMTGIIVAKVNLHIAGVVFAKPVTV